MNKYFKYTYVITFIIIGYVRCADKYPDHPDDGDDSDEEDNFQVIVRGIENILEDEDEDEKTAGESLVSDSIMKHGLGPLTDQGYIKPDQYQSAPSYQQEDLTGYVETGCDEGAVGYDAGYKQEYYSEGYEQQQEDSSYDPNYYTVAESTPSQPTQGPKIESSVPDYHPGSVNVPPIYTFPRPPVNIGPRYRPLIHGAPTYFGPPYLPPYFANIDKLRLSTPVPGSLLTSPYLLTQGSQVQTHPVQQPLQPIGEPIQEKAPSKKAKHVKICETITFFTKDCHDDYVPMNESEYKITLESENIVKYKFNARLEMIMCDNETIYIHRCDKPYATFLTHNKNVCSFIIARDGGFVYINFVNGKWITNARRNMDIVKFYILDCEGNDVELTDKDYHFDLSPNGSFKYIFKSKTKCYKVVAGGDLIWKKNPGDDFPRSVSVTTRLNVIIFTHGESFIYQKIDKGYKRVHDK
ncbi:SVSP family protein [Theileria parva strain Muguga]|uniref:Theileria-specific sub-telomeric protein, SVSP family n=1 Tax=Theileria parva TaxID=5875 RepID=Q4MYF3_THEPA|nr:SVSP family protein [Theileria parva strain Muguga]EAN30729.1 SVSP family protein [Theileria parva strain Muguga]|eukprot:XP_763012.1 hypothetical protein [Theileria parva strain Muguga]